MTHTAMIPYENLKLLNQKFEGEFNRKFEEFLASGWYILGQQVKDFEKKFAAWHQSQFAVGVASGLDALILPLKSYDFPAGSEVLVPSNTYIATILAIIHCGLIPVLVEPNIDTYNIDPKNIEEAITKKTVAIMVVHLYGQCCEMDWVLKISQKYKLLVIEDCAQAHGAKYEGKLAGTFGDYGAFSFYPTKNLGALGDAGAILCKYSGQHESLRKIRNYGSGVKYYNDLVGYNSRLDELQAAFLSVKLDYLDDINNHKRALADIYFNNLDSKYILPYKSEKHFNVYHIFNIRHSQRNRLKAYLDDNGIGTEIHYPVPPHKQKALNSFFDGRTFPISEEIHNTTLSLPCSYAHTTEDIYKVVEVLNSFE